MSTVYVSTKTIPGKCDACKESNENLSEIRYLDGNSSRKLLRLCEDCMTRLAHSGMDWLTE